MFSGIDQQRWGLGLQGSIGFQLLRHVDYEKYVSSEYWQEGKDLVPEEVQDRVSQLELYQRLYEGDYSNFLEDATVAMNFHRLTAVFLADVLMSRPPEFEMEGEMPVSPRFQESLMNALHCVIVDMARYGVGLFQVVPIYGTGTEIGAGVEAPQPIWWFPTSSDSSVLLAQREGFIDKYMFYEGFVSLTTYQSHEDTQMLGAEIFEEEVEWGTPEHWEIVRENSTGMVSTLINTPRRPATGNWGTGLYADITPLAIEFNRRMTQNSMILNEHGNPKIVLVPAKQVNVLGQELDATKPESTLKFQTIVNNVNNQRKETLTVLPYGFEDIKYLEWSGNLRDHLMASQLVQEQLFAATSIPAALYGLGTERPTPSGIALRKQYLRTSVYIQSAQEALIKSLRKAMLIGAIIEGVSVEVLRSFAENMEIVWPNIFDEDDIVAQEGEEETEEGEGEGEPEVEDEEEVEVEE